MNYENIKKKCEESNYLISMVSVEEIIRLGYSMGLTEKSNVLDLCCGYGEVLKIWNEVFGIYGTGVDICNDFIIKGQKRLEKAQITKVKLIEDDVTQYTDNIKYDVVILSETFDSIENTINLGEKFLKSNGMLVYCKTYSKVSNPPQELVEFEGELLTLDDLNSRFNKLGYYITHMASDSVSDWERYITSEARKNINNIRNNPNDIKRKEWADKWYKMYFKYRRLYEGQALFGVEKL
ncbi:MAG: class I SAM-dependent methyltransferase [Firmicutes bacterium]|nr:class I SAM-dependent methyltransferase [Bacillota bacterium]